MTQRVNDGGPAFPQGPDSNDSTATGMSLRDYFAAAALQAMGTGEFAITLIPSMCEAKGRDAEWRHTIIKAMATSAYEIADAMLAAREKRS